MFKLLTICLLAFLQAQGSQAQPGNTEETSWVKVYANLLELRKNYMNAIPMNSQPEFLKRLNNLLETLAAFIKPANIPPTPQTPVPTVPPGFSQSDLLKVVVEIFNAVKTAAPQVAAVQTIVDGILVQVTAAKALLDAPQIIYICVPTRNQVFGK